MKLVKIKISSASTAFRPRPEFNDEVEQRVTIHASGRVRVQRILFGDETVDNVVASNEEFRIPQGTQKKSSKRVQDISSTGKLRKSRRISAAGN